jgi:hypothetical protein
MSSDVKDGHPKKHHDPKDIADSGIVSDEMVNIHTSIFSPEVTLKQEF